MKILYTISTLESCGPVQQLYNIISCLDRSRFEPTILTLSREPRNTLQPLFEKENVQVNSLNLTRLQGFLNGKKLLLKNIIRIDPAIIHSHSFRPDLLLSAIRMNYVKVSTLHHYPYQDYPAKYGLSGYLMAKTHIEALKNMTYRVTVSETNRNRLLRQGVDFVVIPNGVDTKRFFPIYEKEERAALRKKLNLPVDKKIFISLGSLIKRKNPEVIIKGFIKSRASTNAIILMLGEGHLKDKCEKISNNSYAIKFTGQVSNVQDYLRIADCLMSASKSEGMPTAVLEAFACGIPVCLSNIPEHLEIMNYSTNNVGLTFKKGDSEDCARAINSFMEKDPNIMSQAALKVATEQLNAKNMSSRYQELYIKIAKE